MERNIYKIGKELFVTSNEDIKHGDWCLSTDKNFIIKLVNLPAFSCDRKIILTTNPSLIADGVQAIDDVFLEWFVKNLSCEYVEVTCDKDAFPYGVETSKEYGWYKIIIPQEEPNSQETVEEAAKIWVNNRFTKQICGNESYSDIHASKEGIVESHILFAKFQQERMYSEKEVYNLLYKLLPDKKELDEWFEQFKKK
jgi:hypothetical protein